MTERRLPTFFEFFAGGGMARAGLQPDWQCLFANDFDARKVDTYRANWGEKEIAHGDIRTLAVGTLPVGVELIWASFPCQDLSLAGGGAGLKGNRSGTFWPFWSLVKNLIAEGRGPQTIVLENVCGTLTSHDGKDFEAICGALADSGFYVGAMVVDAALFVPQSRPRLFVVGTRREPSALPTLVRQAPSPLWHPAALLRAHEALPRRIQKRWLWWNMPTPPKRKQSFADLVEASPNDVGWHPDQETRKLLSMMSPVNLRKIERASQAGHPMVGTVYRRTRKEDGQRIQRAEIRFDEVAGCLRTPAGGSSRQILMFVDGRRIKSRLISARETARLMGLPDSYSLPPRYNEAYHLTGDGVVVPVVSYISRHLLLATIEPQPQKLAA